MVEKEILRIVEAQEECVRIMQRCTTPTDVRNGFLRVADILNTVPGQETIVNSLRYTGTQPDALSDYQVLTLRDKIVNQFSQQSASMRVAAKAASKKWWQFWK